MPADLAFIRRERFTPVFVLIDKGREIGRIRGYPGDTFFWGLLANLIERLERGEAAPARTCRPAPPAARPSPSDPRFVNGSTAHSSLRAVRARTIHDAAQAASEPQGGTP